VSGVASQLQALDALLSDSSEPLGGGIEDSAFWSESTPESEVLDEVYEMLEELKDIHSLRSLI
jgi:hypothetical protein